MLMTTDRLCMHEHCNHITIPAGQLVTLPLDGVAFSRGVHTAPHKHCDLVTR